MCIAFVDCFELINELHSHIIDSVQTIGFTSLTGVANAPSKIKGARLEVH